MKKTAVRMAIILCLTGFLGLFGGCGTENYVDTDQQAYAVVDNYFSKTQKTQYSGASIRQISVTASKNGTLEIGCASIGETGDVVSNAYAVKKGENIITFTQPLAVGEKQALVLGGGKTDVKLQKESANTQTDGCLAPLTDGALSAQFTVEESRVCLDVQAAYMWQGQVVSAEKYGRCLGEENLLLALSGKYMSLIGDSISTFEGWNNNTQVNSTLGANKVTYPCEELPDVDTVDKTYWKLTADKYGMEILVNNAYGGSKVAAANAPASAACGKRAVNLHADTGEKVGTQPDVIAVYIGTNDSHSTYVEPGKFENLSDIYDGVNYSAGAYDFSKAYAMMLHKIQTAYPNAKVFCFTTWHSLLHNVSAERKEQFNQAIRNVAAYFGVEVVDIAKNSGVDRANFYDYADDGLHPNARGMQIIAGLFEDVLMESYR